MHVGYVLVDHSTRKLKLFDPHRESGLHRLIDNNRKLSHRSCTALPT